QLRAPVQEALRPPEQPRDGAILTQGAHVDECLRPEIAYFEDERHAADGGYEPGGHDRRRVNRRSDHHVWPGHPALAADHAQGVATHVESTAATVARIWRRTDPGEADVIHMVDPHSLIALQPLFLKGEMIEAAGEDRDVVSLCGHNTTYVVVTRTGGPI